MALDILEAQDHDQIRNVMGLTPLDVTDLMIDSDVFGWQAEYEVKQQVGNWSELLGDDATAPMVKLAAIYWTAYLLADGFAKGGTVGNTDEDRERDWAAFAKQMLSMSNRWLDEAKRLEPGPSQLMFLARSEDLRAVRELLGPNAKGLREDLMLNLPFGGRSEQDIRDAITDWRELWGGLAVDPADSIDDWSPGASASMSTETTLHPPGYAPPSVRINVVGLTAMATSASVHTLDAAVDLSTVDVDSLLTLYLGATVSPALISVRLEFQSSLDYMEWELPGVSAAFARYELDYARPSATVGLPDGDVTKVHVRITAGATAYTGGVYLRDIRVSDQRVVGAFRLAAQYGTAAYIAESWAANSAGNRAEAERWAAFAEQLRGYQRELIAELDAGDSDSTLLYDLGGHKVAQRAHYIRTPWHSTYPPTWGYVPAGTSPQTD
jgi:hypothetical protein